jgi:two-component system NtrC family response regulator
MAGALPNSRRHFLVVDDEPEVLRIFKRILSAEGAVILAAQSGAEALEIARQTRLDLVILDLKLPDVSGTEVLRRLRRIDATVPVIVVTSYGSAETVRAAMKLGAFDYLTKPFDNEEIRRVAREALASRAGGPVRPSRSSQ